MSWFLDPGIQDSRSALELANFDWFQHVGYQSHSVYVNKLDFQPRISKFHHSWKLLEIFWNSGYRMEMANFLPISMYRVLFHSVFGLEHDFQREILKLHQSWNLPEIVWNSEFPLDMGSFLLNLTKWVSNKFNVMNLHIIGSILWFLKPGMQTSRNPGIP